MKRLLSLLFVLVMASCCYAQPLIMGALNTKIQSGTIAPNGNVFGNATDLYLQRDVGVGKLWIKQTGMGSLTGWSELGSGGAGSLNNNLEVNGGIGQLGGIYIKNTTSDIDTFNHLYSGINVDNGDTNNFQINGSENAITVLSQNTGITTGFAAKTQLIQGYNNYPGNVATMFRVDSSAIISREDAEGVAIIGAFNDVGNTQASEVIYQKKEGGGVTRDISRIYVQQHDIMMYANRWEDAYLYSKITMDSTQVLLQTFPDSAGARFDYLSSLKIQDSTFTLHLRSAADDYTLWQANDAGAILKTRLVNDSTQIVQDADNITLLVRDGSSNQAIITDANGFAINLTTGNVDIGTTTGAFLPPRMTAVQGSALTPTDGMLIYVTTTNGTFTSVGFWGYENGAWIKL